MPPQKDSSNKPSRCLRKHDYLLCLGIQSKSWCDWEWKDSMENLGDLSYLENLSHNNFFPLNESIKSRWVDFSSFLFFFPPQLIRFVLKEYNIFCNKIKTSVLVHWKLDVLVNEKSKFAQTVLLSLYLLNINKTTSSCLSYQWTH